MYLSNSKTADSIQKSYKNSFQDNSIYMYLKIDLKN